MVTITIEEPVSAGTDGDLDICNFSDGTTYDLFSELGGTPDTGGTWSPALTSGTGVLDPMVDLAGTYTYTVISACNSSPVTADVIVSITNAPNAGDDDTVDFCASDTSVDLITFLGPDANTGGTWSPVLTSGTGIFDPNVDTAGVYTYTVTATSPCLINDTAALTIAIQNSSPPVIVTATPTFCQENMPTVSDLDANVTGMNIIWYEDNTTTTPLDALTALIDGEDYYATQTGASSCESSVRVQIIPTISDPSTPTLNGTNEFCIIDGPTLLDLSENVAEYDAAATPSNIIWFDAATGGNTIPISTALTEGNTYYAALNDLTVNCRSSIRLAVTVDLTAACENVNIPDGFSPNGDGNNDTLDIDGLDLLYPNFEIEIYNRYGNIVYKGNTNTTRFDGTSNQSLLVSKGDLPVGVYYYILNLNDGSSKPQEGSIYLNR